MSKRSLLPQVSIIALGVLFLGDMLVPVVLGPAYPGYSQLHDTLSTLGVPSSPVARATSVWLVTFGVAATALTILLWSELGKLRRLGLLAFAIGAGVISGLFPEDLPTDPETVSGKIHGIGAGLGTLLLIGACLFAPVTTGNRRMIVRGLAVLSLISFALFLRSSATGQFSGLWQKACLGAAYLSILLSLPLNRLRPQ